MSVTDRVRVWTDGVDELKIRVDEDGRAVAHVNDGDGVILDPDEVRELVDHLGGTMLADAESPTPDRVEVAPGLFVGDRVEHRLTGGVGEILAEPAPHGARRQVLVRWDDGGARGAYPVDLFRVDTSPAATKEEPAEPAPLPRFAVGDRVKGRFSGRLGTIDGPAGMAGGWRVLWDGYGIEVLVDEFVLEAVPVEPTPTPPTRKAILAKARELLGPDASGESVLRAAEWLEAAP